MPYTKLTLMT